jgi:drug/metabolite transporter (DMT)-like permease
MNQAHSRGLTLVLIAALLYSTPGLFSRGVSAGGWEVVFWRGLFGILFASAYLAWRGTLKSEMLGLGVGGWAAGIIWAFGSIAYLHAFKLTSIANVSLIYGSAPVLSALVAWVMLRERPRGIVIAASLFAFAGVFTIAQGSISPDNLLGDALALVMTLSTALGFSIYRKYPKTPAAGTAITASLLALPACLIWGHPFSVSLNEIAVLAVFGAVFVTAAIILTEGSKLLPASETALLSNLEVPLQPLLAWLIFTELPAKATFIGGAMVLFSILVSSWPRSAKA